MPFVSSAVERRLLRALPGVSTLACPERLPEQAAEGLDTNGRAGCRLPSVGVPRRRAGARRSDRTALGAALRRRTPTCPLPSSGSQEWSPHPVRPELVEGRLPTIGALSCAGLRLDRLSANGWVFPDLALCAPAQGTGDESFPKAFLSRAVHLC